MSLWSFCPGNVLSVISNSTSDVRTTDSLAAEFTVTRADMVAALDELWHAGKIRHPIGWERHMYGDRNEGDWWRYVHRGPTRGEKRRMWWALIGMNALSNGLPGGAQ